MPKGAQQVMEYFLLRELEQTARNLPADARATVDGERAALLRKRASAEELWVAGASEDAIAVAESAVEGGSVERDPSLPRRYRIALGELDRRLDLRDNPTPREVSAMRRARIVTALLLLLSLIGFIALEVTRKPAPPATDASARWDDRYPADNVVDGSHETDWLLPDKTPGWVELRLAKPRAVSRVKITNSRNPPYYDRSTHDLLVEAFNGATVVKSVQVQFEAPTRAPDTRTLELSGTVDRIRLTVVSHHLLGGGIAEVALE